MTERKVVLVDLDNVVYPWAEAMAHLVVMAGLSGSHPSELIQLYNNWNVWDDWGVPQGSFDFVWEKAIQDGMMWGVNEGMTAFPMPGSVKALWELSDREWHIHLVTHRLNKFRLHDEAVVNTAEWLRKFNIPYRSLTFTHDKHQIHGDVIIDDNPDNLIGHPAPKKILYPAPHNRDFAADPLENNVDGIIYLQDDPQLSPWTEITEMLGRGERDPSNSDH